MPSVTGSRLTTIFFITPVLLLSGCGGGGGGSADHPAATANAAPVASFVVEATRLTVKLNASASLDRDGTITAYRWSFGDNANGEGKEVSHTYAESGTYIISLSVTDNVGVTAISTRDIVVSSPPTQTATITTVIDDVGSRVGAVEPGQITDDLSPEIRGKLDVRLQAGDRLQILDNGTPIGNADVSTLDWQFVPATLPEGVHRLTAVAVNQAGLQGKESPPWELVIGTAMPTGTLNDTGITFAGNTPFFNAETCDGESIAAQDCSNGRDNQASAGILIKAGTGAAGFDFTKISDRGVALPAAATSWSCAKDNVTGLVWEIKSNDGALRDKGNFYTNYDNASQPQIYDGTRLTHPTQEQIDSTTNSVGYVNAVNAQGLCGAKDWRLPTRTELLSLVNYAAAPRVDSTFFPEAEGYLPTLSSTPTARDPTTAWAVSFDNGDAGSFARQSMGAIRLVRSDDPSPESRFKANGDGTANDALTQLMWKSCTEGSQYSQDGCAGDPSAFTWATALQRPIDVNAAGGFAGYTDWRLPNAKELQTLVDEEAIRPAIRSALFPDTFTRATWSSTPGTPDFSTASGSDTAILVDFALVGWSIRHSRRSAVYDRHEIAVRLVRSTN